MVIKVLGPSCANCKTLERRTQEAVSALQVEASIEKVTDLYGIVAYGVMRTPALVIDEKLVSEGRVPTVDHIKVLIQASRTMGAAR
jgi:small redox-active disulfide protein 2